MITSPGRTCQSPWSQSWHLLVKIKQKVDLKVQLFSWSSRNIHISTLLECLFLKEQASTFIKQLDRIRTRFSSQSICNMLWGIHCEQLDNRNVLYVCIDWTRPRKWQGRYFGHIYHPQCQILMCSVRRRPSSAFNSKPFELVADWLSYHINEEHSRFCPINTSAYIIIIQLSVSVVACLWYALSPSSN